MWWCASASARACSCAGLADSSLLTDGYHYGEIFVSSSTRNEKIVFKNGTNASTFPVQLNVVAKAFMRPGDMTLRSSSQQLIASGQAVAARDTLRISLKAYDYERLESGRADQSFSLQLFSGSCESGIAKQEVVLKQDFNSTFKGELPGNWLEDVGEYSLCTNRTKMGFDVAGGTVGTLIAFRVEESSALQVRELNAHRCPRSLYL